MHLTRDTYDGVLSRRLFISNAADEQAHIMPSLSPYLIEYPTALGPGATLSALLFPLSRIARIGRLRKRDRILVNQACLHPKSRPSSQQHASILEVNSLHRSFVKHAEFFYLPQLCVCCRVSSLTPLRHSTSSF